MADDSPNRDRRPPSADRTLRSGAERGRRESPALDEVGTSPGSSSHIALRAPEEPEAGTRFRDMGEIARGGMGSVRKVYDTTLRREVAMKVGDPSNPTYAQAALRFIEEAQI